MEEHQENAPDSIEPIQDTLTHHLPVEIVAQVFIHFVDSLHWQSFLWGTDSYSSSSVIDCAPPLILSAVCRNWRSIAVVTPDLWTSPNIEMYDHSTCDTVVEVLGLWLDRSRDLPLHISFLGDDDWRCGFSHWEPVFERAKASSERWESLRLDINRDAWQFFLKGFSYPPCLKRIQLITPEVEEAEWEVHDPAKFVLPDSGGLEELHIQNLSWREIDVVWKNLVALEAESWCPYDFDWLLGHAPRLKKCRIRDINGTSSGLRSFTVHSHLEDLELHNSSSSDLEDIIRWFEFPSLKRLVYKPGKKSHLRWSPLGNIAQMYQLQSFFTRSKCLLVELEIQVPFKTTADLVEILAHLPSLERLTLGFSRGHRNYSAQWLSNESFAEHLQFSTLSRLLPQLKVFKILGDRTFSWDALLPFLEPPHENVASMRNTCVYIQFLMHFPWEKSKNYIDRDVVLRLKDLEREWRQAVSLDIKDSFSGQDWMQASLQFHGQTS